MAIWSNEDAMRYLRNNPDALRAWEASDKRMGPTLFAQRHYEQVGQAEGRKSGAELDPTRAQPGTVATSPFAGMTDEQIVAQHEARRNNWRGTGRPRPGGNPNVQAAAPAVEDENGFLPGESPADRQARYEQIAGSSDWWNMATPISYQNFRTGANESLAGKSRAAMMQDIADRFAGQQYYIENGDNWVNDRNAPSFGRGWYDPNYLRALEQFYNENRQYAGPDGQQWGDLPTLDYDLIGREQRRASGLTDEQVQSASGLTGLDKMNEINRMQGVTKNADGTWNPNSRQRYRWLGTKGQADFDAEQQRRAEQGVPLWKNDQGPKDNMLGGSGGSPVGLKMTGGVINSALTPPKPQVTRGQAGALGVINSKIRG